ncbi:MAG: DUF3626 domain-containing protein, partial [Deltaproteobacteria bacterium]|nr:DUF3626 domain-containing protein [Deltaproteobacteria bacterium]
MTITTAIKANPEVQRQLLKRGVDEKVGVFGDHQVRLGQGEPIRLDAIRAAKIPFAGFRRASQVASGKRGIDQCGNNALRALGRPGGKLDAGALLGHLKALGIHCQRLDALGKLNEQTNGTGPKNSPLERNLRAFAPLVEKLSNNELSAIYQSFMSMEMDLLLTALKYEGEAGGDDAWAAAMALFDVQGLVLKEVSDRVAKGENIPGAQNLPPLSGAFAPLVNEPRENGAPRPGGAPDMSSANLKIMVERGAQGANTRETLPKGFVKDLQARDLGGISPKDIGDFMRSSELTQNVDVGFFINSIANQPHQRVENIYHLHAQGIFPKGETYTEVRDSVEQKVFPELYKGQAPQPDAHPAYGALNLSGLESGAAGSYGALVIVFKPEVAQRSTFTVDDTFYNIPTFFTQKRRNDFYLSLVSLAQGNPPKIPLALAQALQNVDSPERKAMEGYFDNQSKNGPGDISAFNYPPPEVVRKQMTDDQGNTFQAALIAAFGDRESARGRTATWDSLESLLPGMKGPTVGSMAHFTESGKGQARLCGAQYIEAQIQGGVVPSRDIKEIRVLDSMLPDGAAKEALKKFSQDNGIPLTIITSQRHTNEMAAEAEARGKSEKFVKGHSHAGLVKKLVDSVTANPREAIGELLEKPQGPFAKLPGPTKDLLKGLGGKALENALIGFQAQVASWRNNPETMPKGMNPNKLENDLVRRAFEESFTPVLKLKAELLNSLASLPSQEPSFTNWVLSAGNLRSADEMLLIYNGVKEFGPALRGLAGMEPEPSPFEVANKLGEFVKSINPELSRTLGELAGKGNEINEMDDVAAEFNRMVFLSLPLLKAGPGGQDALEKLGRLLLRPEQMAVLGHMGLIRDHSWKEPNEPLLAARLYALSYVLVGQIAPGREIPPFRGDLSMIPKATRDCLGSLFPGLAEELNQYHPLKIFPSPTGTKLPQDEAARRDFLTGVLLAPATNEDDIYLAEQAWTTLNKENATREETARAVQDLERALANSGPYMRHELTFDRPGPEHATAHGRDHIARSYVFASVFCGLLEEQAVKLDRNAVLLGVGGHKLGQWELGESKWADDSGKLLVKALRGKFGDDSMGQDYENALKGCLTKGGRSLE